jgi:diguanylate cyclase (GGDEF)-like protein/PAS domain S-box-containing protein
MEKRRREHRLKTGARCASGGRAHAPPTPVEERACKKRRHVRPYPSAPLEDGQAAAANRQAEGGLRKSKKGRRDLFEKADEAIFVVADERVVLRNPAACALLGLPPDEPLGESMADFIHPDDREMVLEHWRRRLRGEELPGTYLFRIVRRDGAIRWVDLYAVLIRWDGKTATLCFLTDTTERKAAEQAADEGAEKFRLLFENSPDPIFLLDGETYVDCNAAALRQMGCAGKDRLIGLSPWDIAPERQPDGRLSRDAARELNAATLRQGCNHFEWLRCTFTGKEFWVEMSQTVVPIGGREILYTVSRDITERKEAEARLRESEERYRNIFENAFEGIFQSTPAGRYISVNPAHARMHGYRSPDEMMRSVTPQQLYVEPDGRARFTEQIERDGEVRNFKSKRRRKDGSVFWISMNAHVVRGRQGEILYYEGVTQDITELKKTEEALRESEGKFRNLVEKALVGVYLIHNGLFKYANGRLAEIFGYPLEELVNLKGPKDVVHPDDLALVEENIRKRISGEVDSVNFSFRIVTKSGQVKCVEAYGSRTVYQGKPAIIGTLLDITDRTIREEELLWKTTFLQAMVRSSDDGILIVDSRRPKVLESRRMIEMWKIPQNIVTHGDEEEKIHYVMAAIKNPKGFYDMIVRVHRHPEETVRGEFELKDGTVIDASSHPVLGKDGEQYGRIWKFRDITEMRRYWDMLETLSNTDGLTGLSNRRRFDELLEREWRSALRQGSYLSLILMDIDYFKEFNDRCGHMAGDDCLRRVAGVISSVVRRAGDLAARYGGEEFACILTDTDPDGAVAIANKIMKRIGRLAIQHPCSPGGDRLTMSYGVATLVPERQQRSSDLVRLADRLLYSAKEEGRDRLKNWPERMKIKRA